MSYGGWEAAERLRRMVAAADHDHVWVAGRIVGRGGFGWLVGDDCTVCGMGRYPSTLTADDRADMERLGLS